MRKLFVSITFVALALTTGKAQVKLGIQLNPMLSSSRIESLSDTITISKNKNDIKFRFGLIVDSQKNETYFLSTGLLYAPKTISIVGSNSNTLITENYNLQYLQVPVSLKLFTNEIQLDTKLYFQLGVMAEAKISEKAEVKTNFLVEEFKIYDASLLLGAGVEYNAGLNTVVFGGFSYNRGLLNPVMQSAPIDQEIIIKNDLFNLDLGIKF